MMNTQMQQECETCGGTILIPQDAVIGEILKCPDCGLEYEVKEINGGICNLEQAENVKEDWGE